MKCKNCKTYVDYRYFGEWACKCGIFEEEKPINWANHWELPVVLFTGAFGLFFGNLTWIGFSVGFLSVWAFKNFKKGKK